MGAGDHRADKALDRFGLGYRECRIDDHGKAIGLAAIVGIFEHREVACRYAAVAQVDRGQIREGGDRVDLAGREDRLAHRRTDPVQFHARKLDPVLSRQCRPHPDREIAIGDANRLSLEVGERMDAPAFTGDERVGRFVEQHEDSLDRRRIGLVAKTNQLIDIDQREIAGIGGHARDRVRRSVGDIGTDGEPLRAEQAMVQRHHKRGRACFERTVEGELDRDRLLGFLGRRSNAGQNHQARERGQ